jgi:carbonic anhydrase
MRLIEAIIDANHRALDGDEKAGLHPDEFGDELPIIALTCIDPRLNRLLPDALGIKAEQFIWLRNAGNIIFEPMSSMMRTLALACAVKGGREIAIIGHTDCRVRSTTVSDLMDRFKALGVERSQLPDNLNEFFGLFASERQNVIRGADIIRSSPLIGRKIPVHGLLIDIETGKLEWLVNGYETLARAASGAAAPAVHPDHDSLKSLLGFDGGTKFPDTKIGQAAARIVSEAVDAAEHAVEAKLKSIGHSEPPAEPPPIYARPVYRKR